MSIEVTINCDVCSKVLGAGKTAWQARAGLSHVPGIRLALPGGRDHCPDCAAQIDRLRRAADGEQTGGATNER